MTTAADLMRNDLAFRAYVRSAVAEAHCQFDIPDVLDISEGAALDLAALAASIALKRAFDNDAEITRLRIENEHYKKMALIGLEMTPMKLQVEVQK